MRVQQWWSIMRLALWERLDEVLGPRSAHAWEEKRSGLMRASAQAIDAVEPMWQHARTARCEDRAGGSVRTSVHERVRGASQARPGRGVRRGCGGSSARSRAVWAQPRYVQVASARVPAACAKISSSIHAKKARGVLHCVQRVSMRGITALAYIIRYYFTVVRAASRTAPRAYTSVLGPVGPRHDASDQ